MLFHLVVSIVALVLVHGQDLACLNGWHLYKERNICVKAFDDVEKTWDEARAECQTHDGDLVKTDNPVIRDLVADLLSEHKSYWIGLHGIFEWVDGQKQTAFQWWGCRQPTNNDKKQCVGMIGSKRGRWDDMDCSKKQHFVCQTTSRVKVCDFEIENYAWCWMKMRPNLKSRFPWKRQKAATSIDGPTVDHSNSSQGHYLITGGVRDSLEIQLDVTSEIREQSCLSFWYSHQGFMDVHIRGVTNHYLRASEDDFWKQRKVDIPAGTEQMYFATEIYRNGYFAIDDVRLEPKPCERIPISIPCDFESEDRPFCFLKTFHTRKSTWKRQKAGMDGGLTVDHSNSPEGHYLILKGYKNPRFQYLMIIPELERNSCLSFYVNYTGEMTHATNGKAKVTRRNWFHFAIDFFAGIAGAYFAIPPQNGSYYIIDDARLDDQPCDSLDLR